MSTATTPGHNRDQDSGLRPTLTKRALGATDETGSEAGSHALAPPQPCLRHHQRPIHGPGRLREMRRSAASRVPHDARQFEPEPDANRLERVAPDSIACNACPSSSRT